MQYDSLLEGSPLIPRVIYILYSVALSIIILLIAFKTKKHLYSKLILSLSFFHGIIFLGLAFAAIYILHSIPHVIKTSYQLSKISGAAAIEISFNKPVRRKDLDKSISPSVAGIWLFADPLYATHLYRKVVFYPYTFLSPGTTYQVHLTGIRNFLSAKANSYTYAFKTADVFDVLGENTTAAAEDRITVIGSFPTDGWEEISVDSTIRIRFNQPVDRNSAENHFSITPEVSGTFSWDGDTLIFTPANYFAFGTRYTFFMSSGVNNSAGSLSRYGYGATFTTQEESIKLAVPSYLQKYTLSCEAATLRMVLAFRGITVSEDEILHKIGFDRSGKRGNIWGNPYVGFVGSVRGKQMVNGYGVYWEPIARAANYYRYSKSFENWTIQNLTQSIQKGTPVIVWISIKGRAPSVWTTPTGDQIRAVPDEHTVVVVGFTGPPNNPSQIIVNDPLIGEAHWSRATFEKKWSSLSNSGVLVF